MVEGNILKMKSQLGDASRGEVVQYSLPMGDELVPMNRLLGKKIRFEFNGVINCIATGEQIKKSYNQGYSYRAFRTLARCDLCIVKPELCHYHQGTCREPEWGEKHCMVPHIIYLSLTSNLKIGITRESQVPTRWVDQGAEFALPILKVKDRFTSGLIESEVSNTLKDRTNWRKMIKGEREDVDLFEQRERIFEDFGQLIDDFDAEDLDQEVVEISYPIESIPDKFKSLSFDKTPIVEGTLVGIKGQYLIFDNGVLNIRKHQGYFLKLIL